MNEKNFSWIAFSSKEYLLYYYKCNKKFPTGALKTILKFLARISKKLPRKIEYLEVGGGPAIYSLISISPIAKTIVFSDYLKRNLKEIRRWQKKLPTIIDWDPFIAMALKYEGKSPIKGNITKRKKILKKKIKLIIHCDVRKKNPLTPLQKKFDVVGTHFCPDCITNSFKIWEKNIKNISSLIRPRGWLILATLEKSKKWFTETKSFPSVWLTKKSVTETLKKNGFQILHTQTFKGSLKNRRDSVLLFFARKNYV